MWSVSTAWSLEAHAARRGPPLGYSEGFRSGIDFRGIKGVGWRRNGFSQPSSSGACWRRLAGVAVWRLGGLGGWCWWCCCWCVGGESNREIERKFEESRVQLACGAHRSLAA